MNDRQDEAIELMTRFADRTGLTSERSAQRYLWTDAFAVCNWLSLDRATGDRAYSELALRLVEQVHRTLGRHRPDDSRRGWISGLPDGEGEVHPTRGGLRIGKPLPERRLGEILNERLEWDRDGQHFHYLTKWMHALDRVARSTGQTMFSGWARELAGVAHRQFTYEPHEGARKRMYWKMSIDLTRPLVASMGHHDPLDGFVTGLELERTARELGLPPDPALTAATADYASMLEPEHLATADPLGLGGLLVDANRIEQLSQGAASNELLEALLAAALVGLHHYVEQVDRSLPAARRLAFRELGLAIGLAALDPMKQHAARRLAATTVHQLDQLSRFLPLRTEIEEVWRTPAHREVDTWREHENINDVMLATSLTPSGFLSAS